MRLCRQVESPIFAGNCWLLFQQTNANIKKHFATAEESISYTKIFQQSLGNFCNEPMIHHCFSFPFKIAPFSGSFILIFVVSIQLSVNKHCRWLDANRRSLVLETTTLPIVPQSLPLIHLIGGGCCSFPPQRQVRTSVTR